MPYIPESGTNGKVLIGVSQSFPARWWKWSQHRDTHQLYSLSSSPYCDILTGGLIRPSLLSFGTPWQSNFNPWTTGSVTLGTVQSVTLKINNSTTATAAQAVLVNIEVQDDANGQPEWAMYWAGSWQYQDFSGTVKDWSDKS